MNDAANNISELVEEMPFEHFKLITNNFSEKIGEGAFGEVFKGWLEDGRTQVAVKKIMSGLVGNEQYERTLFNRELQNQSKVQHHNIVKLIGYYHGWQGQDLTMLLCFEYISKGDLRRCLSDSELDDWNKRLKIIKGICEGLNCLHSIKIIHMDLKLDNVLLDEHFEPKIADFGLSRLLRTNCSDTSTQNFDGGVYMPPEFLKHGLITTGADIYSLGLLIMEITTQKKIYEDEHKLDEGKEKEIVKTYIEDVRGNLERKTPQEKECIEIGIDCVKDIVNERPSIVQVISRLPAATVKDKKEE